MGPRTGVRGDRGIKQRPMFPIGTVLDLWLALLCGGWCSSTQQLVIGCWVGSRGIVFLVCIVGRILDDGALDCGPTGHIVGHVVAVAVHERLVLILVGVCVQVIVLDVDNAQWFQAAIRPILDF